MHDRPGSQASGVPPAFLRVTGSPAVTVLGAEIGTLQPRTPYCCSDSQAQTYAHILDERMDSHRTSLSLPAPPFKPRHTERNVGGVPALQGAMPNTLVPELNPARSTRTSLLLTACSSPEPDTQDAQTKAGNNWPKTHNGLIHSLEGALAIRQGAV